MYRVRFKAGVGVNVRDCVRVKPIVGLLCVILTEGLGKWFWLDLWLCLGLALELQLELGTCLVFVRGLELGQYRCLRLRLWVELDEGEGLV